jgi:hypothetical protein
MTPRQPGLFTADFAVLLAGKYRSVMRLNKEDA